MTTAGVYIKDYNMRIILYSGVLFENADDATTIPEVMNRCSNLQ
jgi:hypothetical protein